MRLDSVKQTRRGFPREHRLLLPEGEPPRDRQGVSAPGQPPLQLDSSQPSPSLPGHRARATLRNRSRDTDILVLRERHHCFSQKFRTENIQLFPVCKKAALKIQAPSLLAPPAPWPPGTHCLYPTSRGRRGCERRWHPKSIQFSSAAQSCPTLCYPMGCSTSGFPVLHQLPEPTQTHVHRVGDAIQPSHPLLSPSPPAFSLSQHQGLFQLVDSSHQVAKVLELQLQHQSFQWIFRMISFRMDWLDLLAVQRTQESSPTPQFKSINSSVLSFLCSPTLTSIHDYWKNHSFD